MRKLRTVFISVRLPLWAAALRGLAERSDLEVIGSTGDTSQPLKFIERKRPDVLITDVESVGGVPDLALVRAARQIAPELRVIVISKERDRTSVMAAFAAGVDLYVFHDADPEDLTSGMRQLFNQSTFIAANWSAPSALRSVHSSAPSLTRREFEILHLVAHGYTNGAIAMMLTVTEQTIKFHLSNVFRKLGVSNRTEASRWAQVHGLLSASPADRLTVDAA
jgi:two-component system response regulator DevR